MRRALLMIVILVVIGCDDVNGGGKGTSTTPNVTNRIITPEDTKQKDNIAGAIDKYTHVTPVEINLDDMTFPEAFRIEHLAKGGGNTFWWNGDEYTTDLYVSNGNYNWVRNSDDLDDHCRINKWDECGICNGSGMITWYRDYDKDGLGDPKWSVKDCIYPSVDEE